jgi:DnaJ-domain-containing protein 1
MNTADDDALFAEFLADFDPCGEALEWLTEAQLRMEFSRWSEAKGPSRSSKEKPMSGAGKNEAKERQEKKSHDAVSFQCVFCGAFLKMTFPFHCFTLKCQTCAESYRIQTVFAPGPVFLLVPQWRQKKNENHLRKDLPEAVKKALHRLDLDEQASLSQAKASFHRLVSEYHPDKVAHLGSELRALADRKTREYIAAFQTVQAWFSNFSERAES